MCWHVFVPIFFLINNSFHNLHSSPNWWHIYEWHVIGKPELVSFVIIKPRIKEASYVLLSALFRNKKSDYDLHTNDIPPNPEIKIQNINIHVIILDLNDGKILTTMEW